MSSPRQEGEVRSTKAIEALRVWVLVHWIRSRAIVGGVDGDDIDAHTRSGKRRQLESRRQVQSRVADSALKLGKNTQQTAAGGSSAPTWLMRP